MTRRLHVLTLTFVLMATTSTFAQDTAAQGVGAPARLRVITYNVQFLPGPAAAVNKRKEPEYRAQRIAEEIAKFDLVALQEVFDQEWQDAIANGVQKIWGDKFHTLASPMAEGHNYNGGCMILSKYPFVETNAMVFKTFSKPEDFGVRADGYAAKGVIHARVAFGPGGMSTIDVFATHLEARDDSLRPAQYAEMAEFIKQVADPSRPTLILGDLNTRGMLDYRNDPVSQYSVMMKTLNGVRPADANFVDLWPALMGDALGGTSEQESADIGRRIDYVLLSNPPAPAFRLTPDSIAVNLFQDPRIVALSDHNAVEAEFTLTR